MKKIALAALLCFTGAANACPPGGFGFAFSNQVLLPQFSVQTAVIQQPLVVQQPIAVGFNSFGFSSGFGFNSGVGFRSGFIGGVGFRGGFRGGAVAPFAGGRFRQNTVFRQNTRIR